METQAQPDTGARRPASGGESGESQAQPLAARERHRRGPRKMEGWLESLEVGKEGRRLSFQNQPQD